MSRFQSFIFFEKVSKGNLKIVNFNHEKRPDLANCHFNKGHIFLKALIFLVEKHKKIKEMSITSAKLSYQY